MRRFLFLAVLAAGLLPFTGPAQAQATADQLNKLSLEALTARPAGGGGEVRRSYRPAYHGSARPRYRATYRRAYRGRSYSHARSYAPVSHGDARRARYAPPHRSVSHPARSGRPVHVAHRGRPVVHRSIHVRPTASRRPRHR